MLKSNKYSCLYKLKLKNMHKNDDVVKILTCIIVHAVYLITSIWYASEVHDICIKVHTLTEDSPSHWFNIHLKSTLSVLRQISHQMTTHKRVRMTTHKRVKMTTHTRVRMTTHKQGWKEKQRAHQMRWIWTPLWLLEVLQQGLRHFSWFWPTLQSIK